jgi:hypothetical protein
LETEALPLAKKSEATAISYPHRSLIDNTISAIACAGGLAQRFLLQQTFILTAPASMSLLR